MIPVDRAHLLAAADSHAGMSGKINEDRYAVSAFRVSEEDPRPALFAVLCDGIGGHMAGEVAAETAVEIISAGIANATLAGHGAANPLPTLREAIIQASQTILGLADANDHHRGMGATCACCLVIGGRERHSDKEPPLNAGQEPQVGKDQRGQDHRNQLYIATVGDSRIYLIQDKRIQQLSTDHSWVQEAIDAGVLTPEQARGHPNAHVIRRYLGSRQPVEPDTRLRLHPSETDEQMQANQGMYLRPGDQLVLCSDGLTDLVEDHEILAAFLIKKQKAAIASLIDLANSRGGHDNITIVALQVPESLSQTKPLPRPAANRPGLGKAGQEHRIIAGLNWKLTCLALAVAALALTVLILAGIYVLTPQASPTPTITQPPPSQAATATLELLSFPSSTAAPTQISPETTPAPTDSPPGPTYTPWPTNTP